MPQPGPPVSTATFSVSANRTACSCSGASVVPVDRRSHSNALPQSTEANDGILSTSDASSRVSCPAREISAR
ncbi:hypothetical protein [Kutzneria kofuensis]|uniref:hypothetical protein n=1 Tax=Kutzneria kofuensis TaxID=103725 RepID=UPI0031E83D7D